MLVSKVEVIQGRGVAVPIPYRFFQEYANGDAEIFMEKLFSRENGIGTYGLTLVEGFEVQESASSHVRVRKPVTDDYYFSMELLRNDPCCVWEDLSNPPLGDKFC